MNELLLEEEDEGEVKKIVQYLNLTSLFNNLF